MEKYRCNFGLFPKYIVFNGIDIPTGLLLDASLKIFTVEKGYKSINALFIDTKSII